MYLTLVGSLFRDCVSNSWEHTGMRSGYAPAASFGLSCRWRGSSLIASENWHLIQLRM